MATESGNGQQEVVEVVIEEYDDLIFNEIIEVETLAFHYHLAEEWYIFSAQLEELENERKETIRRMGLTNWKHAIERVSDYVSEELEPLVEIGLTKWEE